MIDMDIRAVAFDVNGTLVEIWTEDDMEAIFRAAGHFLTYQGIDLRRWQVRDLYFQTMKAHQKTSPELHPEFDAVAIWRTIIDDHMTDFTRRLPAEKLAQLPLFLAEMGARHRPSPAAACIPTCARCSGHCAGTSRSRW